MKEKKQPEFDAGYGLAVGLMLGGAIGVCLDNIGVWMPIGLLFGLAIDYSLKRKKNDKNKTQNNKDELD